MKERVNRQTDENLYQPKIHSDRIRLLHTIKAETGKPMTVLVDQAIGDFAATYDANPPYGDESIMVEVEEETWEELCEYRQLLNEIDRLNWAANQENNEQRRNTD